MAFPRKRVDSIENGDDRKKVDYEGALEIASTVSRTSLLQFQSKVLTVLNTYNPSNPTSPTPLVKVPENIIASTVWRA